MAHFGDVMLSYGWPLALGAAMVATSVVVAWGARARRAPQRMWDWPMMRPNVRRLTHQPEHDQV
ncbi:hypothetical protein [Sphingomonas sp.]|jgi:hypothetical protein|uniref:hypothetical protein n=1 Tax=Sphingomonas sp. TaxID=28214 RepID=UPI002E11292A|nr:hypothetical protein [Sphingomonas sp.]